MGIIKTEAWVLHKGPLNPEPAELKKEVYSFSNISEYEVLAEPIYGCWEANMTHALQRQPIDICRHYGREKAVIGNAGVVRILKTGASVTIAKEGDLCLLAPIGSWDEYGYLLTVLAYDAPNTMGLLAKQVKLHEKQVVPIPNNTKYSLQQWAAFPLRYATAWDNWKVAYGCWRLQMSEEDCPVPFVWGWGGGVALAELTLAKFYGCRVAMISSNNERLKLIQKMGIMPIDRRRFIDLDFDEERYRSDRLYKKRYLKSQRIFLNIVKEHTLNSGVSIFIDNIGTPVFPATLRALGRQGIITTVGWKMGMHMSINRAVECMSRHIHVYTHGVRYSHASVYFAEETGWMPPVDGKVYSWDDIPQLAQEYSEGKLSTYFPIFQVNPM